jgi:TolA-binding protein
VHQAREDFNGASMAYLRVQALYPDCTEWVAASIFENAKCLEKLGNKDDARKSYQDLVAKYKGTKWAELAAERLK